MAKNTTKKTKAVLSEEQAKLETMVAKLEKDCGHWRRRGNTTTSRL